MSVPSNKKVNESDLAAATEKLKVEEEVIELDSDSEDASPPKVATTEKRIAKKSTATPEMRQPPAASTRKQVALANSAKKASTSVDRFMENFDPESSARERRKLNRKVNTGTTTRKVAGALYDENGVHIESGADLCDCLNLQCPGCYFPCPKCNSTKCGPECRCNRRYMHETVEFEGCDWVVRNPLLKK